MNPCFLEVFVRTDQDKAGKDLINAGCWYCISTLTTSMVAVVPKKYFLNLITMLLAHAWQSSG